MKARFIFSRPIVLGDASASQLDQLLRLTNSPERGDVHDDGASAGSSFEASIYDELDLRRKTEKVSAPVRSVFIAAHVVGAGSVWLGWCLIEDPQNYRRRWLGLNDGQMAIGFYVDPSQRRTGLGRALVRRSVPAARDLGARALVASPWNSRSQEFFKNVGFRIEFEQRGSTSGRAVLEL